MADIDYSGVLLDKPCARCGAHHGNVPVLAACLWGHGAAGVRAEALDLAALRDLWRTDPVLRATYAEFGLYRDHA